MYKGRLPFHFFWIGLLILGLIVSIQYFSTKYVSILNKKVTQAIEETETPGDLVDATEEGGK